MSFFSSRCKRELTLAITQQQKSVLTGSRALLTLVLSTLAVLAEKSIPQANTESTLRRMDDQASSPCLKDRAYPYVDPGIQKAQVIFTQPFI